MASSPNILLIKTSKVISNFFNPIVSLLIYFIWFSTENLTFHEVLGKFLPILFIIIIPIAVWLFWNVKTGKYSNLDVSNRHQRKSFYFFIEATLLIYLTYLYIKSRTIDWIMLSILILLVVMQISNYFIKSSMHTAFNIFVAALFFTENIWLGIAWLFLAIIIGFTRIILKRHTPQEVLMGGIIGTIVSLLYLFINIQIHH